MKDLSVTVWNERQDIEGKIIYIYDIRYILNIYNTHDDPPSMLSAHPPPHFFSSILQ